MGFKYLLIGIIFLWSYIDVPIKDKKILHLIVASNPYELMQGLMNRPSLGQDSGMLFIFPYRDTLYFWMKDTYIPLDIAFIDTNGVILNIEHGSPLDTSLIISKGKAKYVIEVNQGYFKKAGVKPGDTLKFIRELER